MNKTENSILYIVLILAMAIWGLSWTNGKILGQYNTTVPVLMTWRFLIAAFSMIMVLLARGTSIRFPSGGVFPVLASAVLLVLYNHFYFTGTRLGSAGAGGVLVTTLNPVLTFVLITVISRERPAVKSLLGIFLGILGGSIIINIWQGGWAAVMSKGNYYFVLCASSWAFLTVISSRISRHMSTLTYSFWIYLISGSISFFFLKKGELISVFHLDFIFWINLIAVSVGAMAFATTAYFIATSRLGSQKASAFIFTVPVSAMLFSMLFLDESLKMNVLIGGLISITAVYLINSHDKIQNEK
ncbi:MAG: DMT family transporter [Candidatus Marinimicrobia bacterium]|nr:DMT family transporter [Candidatus Neomarinimicrobiota bacterium]